MEPESLHDARPELGWDPAPHPRLRRFWIAVGALVLVGAAVALMVLAESVVLAAAAVP